MMNGLTVRTSGRDLTWLQFCGLNHVEHGVGELFAEQKVQFANLCNRAVKPGVKDALPRLR